MLESGVAKLTESSVQVEKLTALLDTVRFGLGWYLQPPIPTSLAYLQDFGAPPEQLFAYFSPTPIASASLAQVRSAAAGCREAFWFWIQILWRGPCTVGPHNPRGQRPQAVACARDKLLYCMQHHTRHAYIHTQMHTYTHVTLQTRSSVLRPLSFPAERPLHSPVPALPNTPCAAAAAAAAGARGARPRRPPPGGKGAARGPARELRRRRGHCGGASWLRAMGVPGL